MPRLPVSTVTASALASLRAVSTRRFSPLRAPDSTMLITGNGTCAAREAVLGRFRPRSHITALGVRLVRRYKLVERGARSEEG